MFFTFCAKDIPKYRGKLSTQKMFTAMVLSLIAEIWKHAKVQKNYVMVKCDFTQPLKGILFGF